MNVETLVASRFPAVVEMLREVVALNSYTHNPAGVAAQQELWRDRYLTPLGYEVEIVPEPDRGPHLVARSKARREDGKRLFLVGHSDTVYAPGAQPAELTIDGDRAVGPGSCDMKAGDLVILEALSVLHELGELEKLPLGVYFNCTEEEASAFSYDFMSKLAKEMSAAVVFELARPGNKAVTRRKGRATFRLEVLGRAAHAGNALWSGRNAIVRIAELAGRIASVSNRDQDLTCNIGVIRGGGPLNVVPSEASLEFEVRSPLKSALDEVEARIRGWASEEVDGFSTRFERSGYCGAFEESPESSRLFEAFRADAAKVGLDVQRVGIVGGLSDANHFSAAGVPTIDGVGPMGDGAHTPGEYVSLESLRERIVATAEFLRGSARAWY